MKKYNPTQQLIVEYLRQNEASTAGLLKMLSDKSQPISEDTLTRHLASLRKDKLVESTGKGPSRKHHLTTKGRLLSPLTYDDLNNYLKTNRPIINFKNEWLDGLCTYELFNKEEIEELEELRTAFRQFFVKSSVTIRNRWYQKWLIEFAWKSSSIEGNSYDALETETLLIDHIEAKGKTHAEAIMILNHQTAIRYVYEQSNLFIEPNTALTEKIHALLVNELDVSLGVRDIGVGISGSAYRPLSSKQKIHDELNKTWQLLNNQQDVWSKILASILAISYIQPFEDGNKRTARVMANGVLYANNNIPLVFGNIDPTSYRRACLAFYELGNTKLMKNILLDSWRKTLKEL
jgi:Fic family protein